MYVKMNQSLTSAERCYLFRQIYEVDDAFAAEWVRRGIAEKTTTPPPHIRAVLDRLDEGADRPCLFLPPAGVEFGHEVMTTVRMVHFHRATEKVVCCRPGSEVLYPSAAAHVTDWADPIPDAQRAGTHRGDTFAWPEICARYPDHLPIRTDGFTFEQETYLIGGTLPIAFAPKLRGLRADVLFAVRRREMSPERNWPHWQRVADTVVAAGFTFATVGHRSNSADLAGQVLHTGDLDTDAAIELMRSCRLYVGNDSGTSHLASTAGAPMLLFRETRSGTRDFTGRMARINPGRVEVMPPSAWNDPAEVIARVLAKLEEAAPVEAVRALPAAAATPARRRKAIA